MFGGQPFEDEPTAEVPRMTLDEEYAFQQRVGIVQPGWMIVHGWTNIVVDDPHPPVPFGVRPASIDRLLILSRACREDIP